jgi:hypothetical protein
MSLRLDKNSRQITFSKRRSGLFKKCSEFSILCGAHVAIVVFSEAGNMFTLGSPSVDTVLRRYMPLPAGAPATDDVGVDDGDDLNALEEMCRAREETEKQLEAEVARMDMIGDKVIQAQSDRRFWWEADVEQLGEAELPEFARALERLRDNMHRHVDKLPPPTDVPASTPATAAVAPARDAAPRDLGY